VTATTTFREDIYDAFADADAGFDEMVQRAIERGSEYLDLPVGFLTRIEDGTQEIVQATGEHPLIQPGETCPLEAAYCRRTVEIDGALSVQNAAVSGEIADTAVDTFGLGTYIGAKIVRNDEVYGTICFADTETRETPFTEAEQLVVELVARLTGRALEREDYERELETRNERLRAEKERFEGIAEASFDILFRVDPGGEFTYVSAAVERVLGYDPDEMVGEQFTRFMPADSATAGTAAYERALNGEAENLELEMEGEDGRTVILEVNARPLTEGEEVVGIQGVGRDVTARKEREAELRLKNRAIDDTDVGVTIADASRPDAPLIYVNDAFERITGYPESEAVGRNCRFLQGEATDAKSVEVLRRAVADCEPVTVEILNYRRDGTPFWNRVSVTPVEDESGAVTHFVGVQADVTERKRTEQLLDVLNRALRHNLRNDMNTVLGYSDLVAEESNGERGAHARRIHETAQNLVTLSEKAHELERVARMDRDPQRLEVGPLLEEVCEAYREEFPDADVGIDVRTDRAIRAGSELRQALSELVENALRHAGSARPTVDLVAVDEGEWVEVTVRDDGPGIDDVEAAVVAAGDENALEHGSGLGLWLVNWIVTRYGGSFQIRAAETGGTVATVRLPGVGSESDLESVARRPTTLFW
jgi:PAS domain S-box-containing protein